MVTVAVFGMEEEKIKSATQIVLAFKDKSSLLKTEATDYLTRIFKGDE